ncbi:ATP-dependent RNA helicase DHX29 [Erysiphe neolycopersici]|uniref:RNA helicase n=1 Tax=Erysiphe neolycopersici TaxID=212602 RepID=A0A420HYN8_9PEZI|nr:ATP-dependent RNA helicase DHX29 [Erysiphe neolycopersici]
MAAGKKKKKPLSNPARGFATISIASKPKAPLFDSLEVVTPVKAEASQVDIKQDLTPKIVETTKDVENITAEEFEKSLEESELQILVEKYAEKSKKEVRRQMLRLGTDQRILRSQAEILQTKKWLSTELMDEILQLIKAEGRFTGYGDTSNCVRQASEETLTIYLWNLQQVLNESGFLHEKVLLCLRYILSISESIRVVSKDMIWGLEEALDWLSRECTKEELPDYEKCCRQTGTHSKASSEKTRGCPDQPAQYPKPYHSDVQKESKKGIKIDKSKELSSVKDLVSIDYESDIDPDDLLNAFLDCKTKLFNLEISKLSEELACRNNPIHSSDSNRGKLDNPESAQIVRKLKKIEDDILFDKYIADQQWAIKRAQLQKENANLRRDKASKESSDCIVIPKSSIESSYHLDDYIENFKPLIEPSRKLNQGAAIIEESIPQDGGRDDNDTILADLFSSLPVNEIEPSTGKSITSVNDIDGIKVVIRDFGEWSGVNPSRLLEEFCSVRDSFVKLHYNLVSEQSFSNRHSLQIVWSKPQQITCNPPSSIDYTSSPRSQIFTMKAISAPDSKQSKAFIATTALYYLFGSSKEVKVFQRLPSPWKGLWTEYLELDKELIDEVNRASIRVFRDMVREKRDQELEDGVLIQGAFKNRNVSRILENEESSADNANRLNLVSETHQRLWHEKTSSYAYQTMLLSRMQLPMWNFKDKVLSTIDSEQTVIICGETGCGKSTQVPSFILEHQLSRGKPCKIYITEPRRLSAISLARRVSEELGETRGDCGTNRSLVGYAIRLESNISKETCLVYATTGIVMRMLENSNDLKDITHIVLDEVHERTIDSDFLLIVLKKLLLKRTDLKVILMSATVDAERFSNYLDGAPVLNVPGRTFPVQVKYLEDAVELTGYSLANGNQEKFTDLDEDLDRPDSNLSNLTKVEVNKALKGYSNRTRNTIAQIDDYRIEFELLVQLIVKIATDDRLQIFSNAILVFLPGIGEIRQLNDILAGHPFFLLNWHIYALHSTIANEDQEAAFLVPPPGNRKIILATNIAETGITIPDVTCVIDTGKHREMRFDERRQFSRLLETFISKANAKQRRGRAGRVQEGLCFHMFTKYRHDNIMAEQQTPEFLRLSLQDLAIRVKICKLGSIEEIMSQAMDPPLAKNVRRAIDALIDVRALTTGEDLTPLGFQLARLPLDVFLGKLVLFGSVFRCLDASITIAAILSSKSPFSAPFGARAQADQVRLSFRRGDSDLLTIYNAYLAWKRVCMNGNSSEYLFCRKNFLSQQTLATIEDLKCQLTISLVDSGFLPLADGEQANLTRTRFCGRGRKFFDLPKRSNLNSDNDIITTSVITWSFYPRLLVQDGRGYRKCANNQTISIHPSSVNKGRHDIKWLSYYHVMQAKQFYNAHETTAAEQFSIALLCGDARCDMYAGVISLDGNRARFAVSDWKTLLVIKTLRSRLREILKKSFKNPGKSLSTQQQKWMDIWQKIYTHKLMTDDI